MNNVYQRPPIGQFDPNHVNNLWRKIKRITDLQDLEVAEALNAAGVPISRSRVTAWSRSASSDKFSPLNVAELIAALDAVIAADKAAGR